MTVKELRTKANMSVDDLAWFFKIPRETVMMWEVSGEGCPKCTLDLIEKKLKNYGFFGEEGKRSISETLSNAIENFELEKECEFINRKNQTG